MASRKHRHHLKQELRKLDVLAGALLHDGYGQSPCPSFLRGNLQTYFTVDDLKQLTELEARTFPEERHGDPRVRGGKKALRDFANLR